MLLLPSIDDRRPVRKDGKRDCVFGKRQVRVEGGETYDVVVLQKGAEECGIFATADHGVDAVGEVADAAGGGLESLGYPVIAVILHVRKGTCLDRRRGDLRWKVEHSAHIVLIGAYIGRITIENLPKDVNTASGGLEGGEEILVHGFGTVNAEAVDRIGADHLSYPAVPHALHGRIFRFKIRQ
jgi:hypothetical protein